MSEGFAKFGVKVVFDTVIVSESRKQLLSGEAISDCGPLIPKFLM